jgi:UDP-N-acetylmuramate dehydrogenase
VNSVRHDSIEHDVDLAPLTTYKLGGPALWFADVGDEDTLRSVVEANPGGEILVLGRGSNLVVSDAGYPGLVLRLVGDYLVASIAGDGSIAAGAGMPLPKLARFASAADRGGLEFFVGIPGSVGGAVRMNAGGHGSDTAAWLIDASIFDVSTGAITRRSPSGLDLSYRHSNLVDGEVVLDARFHTIERPRAEGEALLRDITRWRKEHQPGGTLNAGSVFKNPEGDSAGRIIDASGLKGYRRGGVAVSDLHANFFVSDRDATAQDVWDLVWAVRRKVGEETGVWLSPELRFVGAFERSGDEEAGP